MFSPLSWLNGILSAVTALAGLLDTIAQAWQRWQDRQGGRNEQKVADHEKDREAERDRVQSDARIAAADDAERLRLRNKWSVRR